MKKRKKVIIDCDPGIDDSLALIYALKSQDLDILGITIVCGNVPVEQGVENALKALEITKALHIPVYIGEEKPIYRELVTAQDTHGQDGVGECYFSKVNGGNVKPNAVDYIVNTLRDEEELSIIALGPLTNIAKALMKDRKAFEKIHQFVSMGGAFRIHGNCSPVAEFNYWVDPHSADYVYKNLGKKIHMIGLDVTRKIVLTPNILEFISRLDDPLGSYIVDITKFYVDFHWNQEAIVGCVINDPLAVCYFIDNSICEGFSTFIEVVQDGVAIGQTIVDIENFWKREHNSIVLNEVDYIKFMHIFLETLFPQKLELIRKTLKSII